MRRCCTATIWQLRHRRNRTHGGARIPTTREEKPTKASQYGERAVFDLLGDGEWHDGWKFYDVRIVEGTSGNQRKNELKRRMVTDGVGDIEKRRVSGKPYP